MKNEKFTNMPDGFKHWDTRAAKFCHICECCNREFNAKKSSGVKFCSQTCRKRASNGHKQWNTACRCKHCDSAFFTPQPFQHPEYCSNACRQAAYRARKVTASSHITPGV